MTTEFVVTVVIKVTLVLSSALAVTWAMRHLILAAAFCAIAVLPFAEAWVPAVRIPTPVVMGSTDTAWFDDADVFLRGIGAAPVITRTAEGTSSRSSQPRNGYGRPSL